MNKAGLALAAQVADFEVVHWGPTTILIGPGTLELDYDYADGNIAAGAAIDFTQSTALTDPALSEEIHVVGAGRDQTLIKPIDVPPGGIYTMLKLDAGSWPTSSISDLSMQGTG